MDGIEAAKILTEERIAPVVLLTAFSQRDLVDRARRPVWWAIWSSQFKKRTWGGHRDRISRFVEFRELEKEVDNLQDQLETQAGGSGQGHSHGFAGADEAAAFRRIQKMSMNTRKSMREIAQAIILTHEAGG
jgi:response regulator NasT